MKLLGKQYCKQIKRRIVSTTRFSVLAICLILVGLTPTIADDQEYILDSGDVITITVFGEKELSLNAIRVPKKGTVQYPLIGELEVSGKTTGQLEEILVKKFKAGYLKKPKVSVAIHTYRPFFINGQVSSPGAYPYVEGLTARKAITIAGGMTERGSEKKITILKEGQENQSNVDNLDIPVSPGDILSIGETIF